jgi:hypothetical protein
VQAAGLANPDRREAVEDEIRWQLQHMSADVRAALRALPPVGENSSGPLGPGASLQANSAPSSVTCKPVSPRPIRTNPIHRSSWRRALLRLPRSRSATRAPSTTSSHHP